MRLELNEDHNAVVVGEGAASLLPGKGNSDCSEQHGPWGFILALRLLPGQGGTQEGWEGTGPGS